MAKPGRRPLTPEQQWNKVNKGGTVPAHMPHRGPCWLWEGRSRRSNGGVYGFLGKQKQAWHWTWEQVNGPVPEGLTLDHLCRNTLCVNPDHLDLVTMRINLLRGTNTAAHFAARTHCNNGHEYTPENTRITKAGARLCRTCRRITNREEKARAKIRKLG